MAAARDEIFSACRDRVSEVLVQPALPLVVDTLSGMTTGVRLSAREVEALGRRATGEADPALLHSMLQDLLATGSLIHCGTSNSRRGSTDSSEAHYLLPVNVFKALSALLIKPDMDSYSLDSRQNWFKLLATGRASRAELSELLASESSPLTLSILEELGIAFRFQPSSGAAGRGDSGFADDSMDFVIPYFLVDGKVEGGGGGGDAVPRGEGQRFVLTFEGYVTWRDYFWMVSRLSVMAGTEAVVMEGQGQCSLRHGALQLRLGWSKHSDSDTVLVAALRLDRQAREGVTTGTLQRLFSSVLPASTPFKLHEADSAVPWGDLPSLPPLAPSTASPIRLRRPPPGAPVDDEETLLKPAMSSSPAPDEVSSAGASPVASKLTSNGSLPLTSLPWSVLNQVAIQLTVPMPTGHDWKSVAGEAGKSQEEICAYEFVKSQEVPAMTFLREWMLTASVQQLLEILQRLERPDVHQTITNHLGHPRPQ